MDKKIFSCDRGNGGLQKGSDDGLKHKPIFETTYASPERVHKRVDAYMQYLQGGLQGGISGKNKKTLAGNKKV